MSRLGAGVSPWPVYDDDEREAVDSVLRSGKVNLWTGSDCKTFEQEFARSCEADYAISLANGTLALELALEAAGIGIGDDVIVTPRTFLASASCVVRVGARPVFADVCPDSQNITAASVREALTSDTRAVIAVHHAGWPCDMDGLMQLASDFDLTVVEDCAQAHGATLNARPIGGLGHVAAFSFCQDKIISTGGEGGMLVTNNEAIWKKAWSIKDHGKDYDATFHELHPPGFRWLSRQFGSNYRMTEMQAAIGRVQLSKLESWSQTRNANAARIIDTLNETGIVRTPVPPPTIRHAYYRLYSFVRPELLASNWDRDRIMAEISAQGVPCFSGSCPEIYKEQAFENLGLTPEEPLVVANELGPLSLAFLVHPSLTEDDLSMTCAAIRETMAAATK